jgi:polyphosphate kinase
MAEPKGPDRFNRELSWLAFNGRVLQEAEDESTPLFERLMFLSIFTSNLEEFFRVRVAWIRSLLRLKKKKLGKLGVRPGRALREIHNVVAAQQVRFGEIFRTQILPELERNGILLIDETAVTREQGEYLRDYFRRHVAERIQPVMLDPFDDPPFLRNRVAYLVVELWPDGRIALSAEEPRYALVEIPSPPLPRFVSLPPDGDDHVVMFLDDVIRYNLPMLFAGCDVGGAHAVKLTRDAELYIEDEFNEDLVTSIRKAVRKRETGTPSSFQYDLRASHSALSFLKKLLQLEDEDLVVGGRYHNLHDLADFPHFGKDELCFETWTPSPHPVLETAPSMLRTIREKDRLLHFPYHSYKHVLRFLTDAANDPDVEEIWLTVYRVSPNSKILSTLERAAERGKRVRVFVEVKARFDEEKNLQWAERMEQAGIITDYSMPGLKVHAKIALVVRREDGKRHRYACLGTGNFNEETARVYTDWGLLTADPRLTVDIENVFQFLAGENDEPVFHHCLVSPFTLRAGLSRLIAAEAHAARKSRPAGIIAKMNALEDPGIIDSLYAASRAGVPMQLLVRGICCLVPGVEGQSETIDVRSIVDRYLEHGRAARFVAGGENSIYLGSADWMHRNLDRRVEVVFPLYDEQARAEIECYLGLQLADNVKARRIDAFQSNGYVRDDEKGNGARCRAQAGIRRLVAGLGSDSPLPTSGRSAPAESAHDPPPAHSTG